MDGIPVFSQLKSAIQFACHQTEQALQTQINFSRQCPIVSQVRSLAESISGDNKAAQETQKECGLFLLNLCNGIPVVGHIKGGIHYAFGDAEGGDAALKAASHTSGVMVGGAVGFLVGGPPGAIALGIGGGAAMDATITAIDTQIKGKLQPYGFVEPLADPKNAGKWCDAVAAMVFDGFTGHATGTLVKRVQAKGAAKAAGRTAATAIEDDLVGRTVRYSARPFTNFSLGNLIVMLMEGTIFLLKDGRLQIIKDIYSDVTNRYTTTGHVEAPADAVVQRTAPQFHAGEFVIQRVGNVLKVYVGEKLVLFIQDNKVYIKDSSGNDVEIQENHVYTMRSTGEVDEVLNQVNRNYIEEVITDHEEFCDSSSVLDTEDVYQDSHDIILDLEEEQFSKSDDVLQNNDEEHQGLPYFNTHRNLTRGTN